MHPRHVTSDQRSYKIISFLLLLGSAEAQAVRLPARWLARDAEARLRLGCVSAHSCPLRLMIRVRTNMRRGVQRGGWGVIFVMIAVWIMLVCRHIRMNRGRGLP